MSLDVGYAHGLDLDNPSARHKAVCFAYTGNFTEDAGEYWGFRPVVGCWFIDSYPDDGNHPAQLILVNWDEFPPNQEEFDYRKFNAGLPRVDLPWPGLGNDAVGAALVFIQDTETDEDEELTDPGRYEIYGTSSLDYPNFTWISDPNGEDFTEATLPSVAVNSASTDRASVTFLAGDYQTTAWQAWATLWDMPNSEVSAPTSVDALAQGVFALDSFLAHDWGTASSIAMFDANSDNYWACWSDKTGSGIEPGFVFGALGFANP